MRKVSRLVKKSLRDKNVCGSYTCFYGDQKPNEYHFIIFPLVYEGISTQIEWITRAYNNILEKLNLSHQTCVFRRFFFSDLPNQYEIIKNQFLIENLRNSQVSIISQPPYSEGKIALWAYHICDAEPLKFTPQHGLIRGKLVHFWDTNIFCAEKQTVYQQTLCILKKYKKILVERKMRFKDNIIRTWFFVQDIDNNYREFVEARKKVFKENGLMPETHFVASTGVEGTSSDIRAKVSMDAYSIKGISEKQIKFLKAPEYISPTYVYGVTFERGVMITYRDRVHVFISGTASINNTGEIVHPGDVKKQMDQTLTNINILLNRANCSFDDVCLFIVYVRDITDAGFVYREMKRRFNSTPFVVVMAKVCRPGWLVEIECQAIREASYPDFPEF